MEENGKEPFSNDITLALSLGPNDNQPPLTAAPFQRSADDLPRQPPLHVGLPPALDPWLDPALLPAPAPWLDPELPPAPAPWLDWALPPAPAPRLNPALPPGPGPVPWLDSALPPAPAPRLNQALPPGPAPWLDSALPPAPAPRLNPALPPAPVPWLDSALPPAPAPRLNPALPPTSAHWLDQAPFFYLAPAPVAQVVSSQPQQVIATVSPPPEQAVAGQAGAGQSGSLVVRRGRGRPRMYTPYGSSVASSSRHAPQSAAPALAPQSAAPDQASPSVVDNAAQPRKPVGRPLGSTNRPRNEQLVINRGRRSVEIALSSSNITPYIFTVNAGEDVTSKIIAFCQQVNQQVSVLSANGTIRTAMISPYGHSGGAVIREGHYELLTLDGSFAPSSRGLSTRTGQLTVTLADPAGRVEGGIASLLIAANPVQVVLAGHPTEDQLREMMPGVNPRSSNVPAAFYGGQSGMPPSDRSADRN